MRIAITKPLFAWDCLEDSPSLQTTGRFLEAVPDGKLLESLRRARGKGRNDYPIHVLWGVVLLTPLLRHSSFEGCLGELRRNEALRRLIGIESEEKVPKKWNISRFLNLLGQEPHLSLLREVFDTMIRRLGSVVPDLGRNLAGDATSLHARRARGAAAEAAAADGLPDPAVGRKEYCDESGNVTQVIEWFGYKLHLLVDAKHEVAVSYAITAPTADDGQTLPTTLAQAQANLPTGRIRTLAYDKAADSQQVHATLQRANIKPVIQNRSLWKDQTEQMLPGHDGRSNIVYDEAGTVYCYDRVSNPMVRHRMAYIGHEPQRQTLKYRCPARHEGWQCPSDQQCNAGKCYGKTVRVKQTIDLRRFPPIPRATRLFERLYKGRTAAERVNGRLKVFWGADDGNISGACRFFAFVGVVMIVHAGLATVLASLPRYDGTLGQMNLSPIAKKLQTLLAG